MNRNMAIPIAMLALIAFAAGTMYSSPIASTGVGDGIVYGSLIQVYKNDELIDETHNVLTNGEEAVEDFLLGYGNQNFTVMVLGNDSGAPADGDTTFPGEVTAGTGLDRTFVSTIYDNGDGNWSLYHQWTADQTFMNVSKVAVANDSTAATGMYLAAGTFTSVNLENSDTLAVNYTLWVS